MPGVEIGRGSPGCPDARAVEVKRPWALPPGTSAGAPSASPPNTGASSSFPYEPPSQRPRSRVPLYAGIAVLVVVVVAVAAIVVPALSMPGPSIPSGAITYRQGAPGANYSVRSFQSSTWTLVFVAGLEAPTTEPAAVALADLGVSNCTVSPASGQSGNITLPADSGSLTLGHAPLWEYFYENATTQEVAVVVVENGHATVLGTLASAECSDVFGIIFPIPGAVLDSPTIGAAVATNATGFLATHPNASAVYGLIGPIFDVYPAASIGPRWVVEFSTCPITPDPTGVGAEYNVTLNATSGAVIYAQSLPSVSCVNNPPAEIGSAPLPDPVASAVGPVPPRPR
jgi:hypothetical protein